MKNVEIKVIDKKLAKPFLMDKHYLHRDTPSLVNYGLYYKGELHGVITYSNNVREAICKQINEYSFKENTLELSRLFIDDEVSQKVKNITSYFVSHTLKDLGRHGDFIIISYADEGVNHFGAIYQATNFKYYGTTKRGTYCYNGKDVKGGKWEKGKYYRFLLIRSPKHIYITVVGRKKLKKDLWKAMKLEEEPYPKGDKVHYDSNYVEPRYVYDREEEETYKEEDLDYDLFLRSYEGMGHKGLSHSQEWLYKMNKGK